MEIGKEGHGEARVAEVAVPRDVDRTFDYLIPEELRGRVEPGMRAEVPFRGETLTGFVVALKGQSDYRGRLLPLGKLLDPEPVLDEVGLALARRIAAYYVAPLGRVLAAMVPSGVARPRSRARPRTGGRTRAHAALAVPLNAALRALEELRASAPQQAALLQELLASGETPPASELLARVGCSEAPLQALVRKGLVRVVKKPAPRPLPPEFREPREEIALTDEQHRALQAVREGLRRGRGQFLLHGVNAGGKTEVYLQGVQDALERGKGAIVLVPEISLTPQLVARFRARFGDLVALYHSGLTEAQRAREWERITRGEARAVVGVRSAVFVPLPDLGLIVVDEEHEPTYKQDDPAPRYDARWVARRRAELEGAVLLLGSATPSIESYHRARRGGLQLLEITERAVGGPPPRVEILDLKGEDRLLTPALAQRIARRLKAGEQTLLLLNLRGFSRAVFCRRCRETQKCPHCRVALVYHYHGQRLRCHLCGRDFPVGRCRRCKSRDLAFLGAGTQQAERALREAFPGARVVRMDSDAVRRGQHGPLLEAFRKGEIDILLGTQMIGLGLDFPNVTLVGVLSADTLLDLPDFRAGERTFQLVSQAVGRAGRGPKGGEVVIQTNHPEHYAISLAAAQDYRTFYEEEIVFRRALGYPPFSHLVKITVEDVNEERAERGALRLHEALRSAPLKGLEVLGPYRALPYRVRGLYRHQLVLKTRDAEATAEALRALLREEPLPASAGVKIDVDPQSLVL